MWVLSLLILVGVLGLGYLLAHKLVPFVVVRVGRLLGFRMKLRPIMARRVERFKRIKRGHYAFLLITTLFTVSLFLELLVNDKALLIVCEGRWASPAVAEWADIYMPFLGLSHYQRQGDFGLQGDRPVHYRTYKKYCDDPDLILAQIKKANAKLAEAKAAFARQEPKKPPGKKPTPPKKPGPDADEDEKEEYQEALSDYQDELADYRYAREDYEDYRFQKNDLKTQQQLIAQLERSHEIFKSGKAWIVMPLYPYHPSNKLLEEIAEPPPHAPSLKAHPLGTTDNATDVLTQLVYGFRIAIVFALIVATVGYSIGVIVGGIMGYYGGWIDILVQRFVEIWGSIPFLFTIMIIASIIQPNVLTLALLLIVLRGWLGITWTIRGEFYREKARDYVAAARAMGVSDWKIITRHILPNSLVPVVTFAPFGIVAYIFSLVSLDYLGFGLRPGTPSWGYLLQQGQEHVLAYPHLIIVPSLAIAVTLFCVVMIGEAVREGFDPKVFSRLR